MVPASARLAAARTVIARSATLAVAAPDRLFLGDEPLEVDDVPMRLTSLDSGTLLTTNGVIVPTTAARIGPDQILTSLGTGGMGEVDHARDLRLGRGVAIKVLTSSRRVESAEPERFDRQARSARPPESSEHLHALRRRSAERCHLPGHGASRGGDARGALESGHLPIDRALALAVQIAEALDAAQTKG